MRPTPRFAGFPFLLASLACSELNFEPVDNQRLDPPPLYEAWWSQVEDCTGVEAPFERVIWYRAAEIIERESGTSYGGAWQRPHNIYISSRYVWNRRLVTHEMIHDLLQAGDHSDPAFARCSG